MCSYNLYRITEKIITADRPETKINLFKNFYDDFKRGLVNYDWDPSCKPLIFDHPSFASFCTITVPEKTPPRSKINSREGRAALLHSIAHIEYNAIDLALDAVYRFRGMPRDFVHDWLEVANEEIQHFESVMSVLKNELNTDYGDIAVHQYLFNVSMKTLDLADRMAAVHCHLEAIGLDVNPGIMKKFANTGDPQSLKIVEILKIILRDETDHVRKGLRWYSYAARKKSEPDCPVSVIRRILPNTFPPKTPLNREARSKAGFSIECMNQYN